MARWLVKSDPEEYSAADLERDAATAWTGVKNALAQKHLQAMRPGDPVLMYHTGDEKAVVSLAKVARGPLPDPTDPRSRRLAIELQFERWLPAPVALARIKSERRLARLALVRIGRLSVMPVNDDQWRALIELANSEDQPVTAAPPRRRKSRTAQAKK